MSKPADMDRLRREIHISVDEAVDEVDRLKAIVSNLEDERDELKAELAALQAQVDKLEGDSA